LDNRLEAPTATLGNAAVLRLPPYQQATHCALVYFEVFADSYNAISREKQIKAGSRAGKERLIRAANPEWRDLLPGG